MGFGVYIGQAIIFVIRPIIIMQQSTLVEN